MVGKIKNPKPVSTSKTLHLKRKVYFSWELLWPELFMAGRCFICLDDVIFTGDTTTRAAVRWIPARKYQLETRPYGSS